MSINFGRLLGEGLIAGIGGYANAKGAENVEARKMDQETKLAGMKQASEMAIQKAKQAMARPEISNVHATDDNGNPVDRSLKQNFDPNANDGQGGWTETTLGEAPVPRKPITYHNVINGGNEVTMRDDPNDGSSTAVGAPGPRFNPRVAADPAAAMDLFVQKQSLLDDIKTKAAEAASSAKNKRQALALSDKTAHQFEASLVDPMTGAPAADAKKIRNETYLAKGINPTDYNADEQFRAALVNEHLGALGDDPIAPVTKKSIFSTTQASADSTAKSDKASKGSAENPIDYTPGMPKPPTGSHVRKPDGSVVVVQ